MQLIHRSFLLSTLALCVALPAASAQRGATQVSPNDSLFRRARKLVAEGNGTVGRALVDSALRRAEEGSADYGDALYWRGALAQTAADAERDYRRVIVEYPLSLYLDDALLAIAELEQARGDRAAALQHLQRFVREHPVTSPARGVAAFAAARLAFEQRDNKTGCGLVNDARASTASTNVELRNQIEYYASRCPAASTDVAIAPTPAAPIPAAPTPTPPVRTTPVRDTATSTTKQNSNTVLAAPVVNTKAVPPSPVVTPPKKATTPPPVAIAPEKTTAPSEEPVATKPAGIYTIQVAAFNTRAEAERLVAKLGKTNVKARVSNTSKPFRVRLQFFSTRKAAADEVASLKARGIIGFVTTEAPEQKTP